MRRALRAAGGEQPACASAQRSRRAAAGCGERSALQAASGKPARALSAPGRQRLAEASTQRCWLQASGGWLRGALSAAGLAASLRDGAALQAYRRLAEASAERCRRRAASLRYCSALQAGGGCSELQEAGRLGGWETGQLGGSGWAAGLLGLSRQRTQPADAEKSSRPSSVELERVSEVLARSRSAFSGLFRHVSG